MAITARIAVTAHIAVDRMMVGDTRIILTIPTRLAHTGTCKALTQSTVK